MNQTNFEMGGATKATDDADEEMDDQPKEYRDLKDDEVGKDETYDR